MADSRRARRRLLCAALLFSAAACDAERDTKTATTPPSPLVALRRYETKERARAHFEQLPPSNRTLGADPYALAVLADGEHLIGVLRGRSELELLDRAGTTLARAAGPPGTSDLVVAQDGSIFAVGELSSSVYQYRVKGRELVRVTEHRLPDVVGLRSIEVVEGEGGYRLLAVDELNDRLVDARLSDDGGVSKVGTVESCRGPFRLQALGGALLVNCLIDHSVVIYDLTAAQPREMARIQHDAPLTAMAGHLDESRLLLVLAGTEDHPLDRTIGSFGYVDSYLFVYAVQVDSGEVKRLQSLNVAEYGVVNPRTLLITQAAPFTVELTGYASRERLTLTFADPSATPKIQPTPLAVGLSAVARLPGRRVYASPLFDSWVIQHDTQVDFVHRDAGERSTASRLGEALFFTYLMAPSNSSKGALSRFSCETCHFEGYVDGRTHHTGRGDVHATTKPLLGLFNNRPHFSRALDLDLSDIAHNEFRVAGAGSGKDPWFSLEVTDHAWLRELGVKEARLDPDPLRRALMRFLMDFTHRTNPNTVGRSGFSQEEARGADLFQAHCEGCHQARLSTDVEASRQPRDRWQRLILDDAGPLVWASDQYAKTGVTPYVHERGARVPSLRRLQKKRPYFTNGSAASLDEALARIRMDGNVLLHQAPPNTALAPLFGAADQAALKAFLLLL